MTPTAPNLIPKPYRQQVATGSFLLDAETRICASEGAEQLGRQFQADVLAATGLALQVVPQADCKAIRLSLDGDVHDVGCEGYLLRANSDGVEIKAPRVAGLFYGIQTLKQLLPAAIYRRAPVEGVRWEIPVVEIEDHPRFPWRGAHLDVSRHFMPREFVLKFIDLMALHKLNILHMHLTDSHGWRMEIKKYPELARRGSRTDFSQMNPEAATRSVSQRPGGYYSQDDLREIVAYAAARFITVVPEIEMPGHSLAPIQVYPQYGNAPQVAEATGDPTALDDRELSEVYNVEPATLRFLQDVLDEVMEVFPSPFIHIGGDEVSKDPWKRNPKAQAKIKELGLADEDELQSWFIRQMDAYIQSKGRRLVGWDEILEGGLAEGATVMSWRGEQGGIKAAQAGHDVVMSPGSHTYLDHYQSRLRHREPLGIGGFTSTEKAYSYEPVPAELSNAEAIHVLGAQFQLWSEWFPHGRHVEYMAYPRGCALAEVFWSPKGERSFAEFGPRLNAHFARLDALDVNYRRPAPEPEPVGTWHADNGTAEVAISLDVSGQVMRAGSYTLAFVPPHHSATFEVRDIQIMVGTNAVARFPDLCPVDWRARGGEVRVELPAIAGSAALSATLHVLTEQESSGEIFLFLEPQS